MQDELFPKPPPLVLTISGNIPSFKNHKVIVARTPQGKPLETPFLITRKDIAEKAERIVDDLCLQLLSAFQTSDGKTLTGASLRSAIALSMPADDSWRDIPIIQVRGELCEKGQEGATVTITRL